jgi:chromosome segregation ATPase
MSSRGSRKRSPAATIGSGSSSVLEYEPPTRRSRRDVLSCELETIQAELKHERSLRALDSKRFVQIKQRLQKQCEFAAEEVKESKALMEEMREENERHLDQLRRAMARTKAELLDVREDLDEERALASRKGLEEDPRIYKLEDDVEAKSIENDKLQETIDELREDMRRFLEEQKSVDRQLQQGSGAEKASFSHGSLSEARPEVLKELNRVRVHLAESERKNRQYKRMVEEAQRKSKDFVQEKEKLRSANKRMEQLQTELRDTTRAKESVSEKLQSWQELGNAMMAMLGPKSERLGGSESSICPDIDVLQKYINDTKKRAAKSEENQIALKKQLETADTVIQNLESEKKTFGRKESAWKEERKEQDRRQQLYQKEIKVLRGQEDIYKREVESLRTIVKTFDELPIGPKQGLKKGSQSTANTPANFRVLEASLTAAREGMDVLKKARGTLQVDLDSSIAEKEELQEKHNRVLEKFEKLRDALYAERSKAEKAIERANEAEILAGKGSFNPERTRVLHMGTNPLTVALKEEIVVLKKQVEVLTNGDNAKRNKSSYSTDVDPNKLHQRLKESFKEQISRFREGVYLMTGYKVNMY